MSEWTRRIRLVELARGPVELDLEPDAAQRAAIAKRLRLVSLPSLRARLVVRPWLDGAEIRGRFDAVVEQVCSVSAEEFEQPLAGEIDVRVVPQGSPNAPRDEGDELAIDPDGPEPPDVLEGEEIDLAAYVIEHLSLEIDPFPRKPGATFDYQPETQEESPFAVLKRLQERKG